MVRHPFGSQESHLIPSKPQTNHPYKGIRKRSWGRWVSEIRMPHSRERIWLGSYSSAQEAARAYDAAAVCLRGCSARLNFPDSPPPLPITKRLTKEEIKSIASAAALGPTSSPSAPSSRIDSTSCLGDREDSSPSCQFSPQYVSYARDYKIEEKGGWQVLECLDDRTTYELHHSHQPISNVFDEIFKEVNNLEDLPPSLNFIESQLNSVWGEDTMIERSEEELLSRFNGWQSSCNNSGNSAGKHLVSNAATLETTESE